MTPTLGMVVQREAAISAFVPEPFYTVRLMADGCEAVSDRFTEKSAAVALRDACKKEMQTVVKTVVRKEKQEKPPALYDLTTLQRDANRLLGFTAQQTLTYLQSLYRYRCCVICGALAPSVRQGTLRFPYADETSYPFSNPPPPNLYEIFAAVTVLLYFLQKARW